MKSKRSRFISVMMLMVLFGVTIFSLVIPGRGEITAGSVHVWAGGFLGLASAMHLFTHREWMQAALSSGRQRSAPIQERRNLRTDLGMAISGGICMLSGVLCLVYPLESLGRVHAMSGFVFVVLIVVHLALHRNWMANALKAAPAGKPG